MRNVFGGGKKNMKKEDREWSSRDEREEDLNATF